MNVIVIHGGAGKWPKELIPQARAGVQVALRLGYETLTRTNDSLKAVLAATRLMEDNEVFNCGRGSALSIDGQIEMDAAIMTSDGCFGAVAALRSVRHPIDVAYKVMTETSHLLLAGSGATKMARLWGFPRFNPMTEKARRQFAQLRARPRIPWMPEFKKYLSRFGTAGVVALDHPRRFAGANSTGGYRGKLPGRVGDTPIYGAGTFAGRYGGVTATGVGEEIIRLFLSKTVHDQMRRLSAQEAINRALTQARRVGLIAIDTKGRVGVGFTTAYMPYGSIRDGKELLF
ncbi:MAG: isoaspartyl peptidase/L-asparaginase [candidate division WOR-3 bacterium]